MTLHPPLPYFGRRATAFFLLLYVSWLAAPLRLAAAFTEPDGWGKAKLRMKDDAFAAAYPKAQLLAPPTPAGGNAPPAPFSLSAYRLEHQKVGSLGDCRVEFRFYEHELYDLQFLCTDKDAAVRELQKKFGVPTRTVGNALMWVGKQYGVSQVPKTGVFSYHDIARAQAAQSAVLQLMGAAQRPRGTTIPGGAPSKTTTQ
jgi:hypothetical protein